MSFDEQPLDRTESVRPPGYRPPPPAGSPTRWIVVGALAVVAGGGLAFWWMTRAQPGQALPVPVAATDVAKSSNRPQRQPLDLPALDASDSFARELIALLSRHPHLARLLATDRLIRSSVLAVEQIGDGRTPILPLRVLRPDRRLTIIGGESGRIDPKSYTRWDDATSALTSINPAEASQLYVNLKPLFDTAYQDLGHPDADFDQAVRRAIEMLVMSGVAPEPSDGFELLRRPGYFEHAEAAWQSLRPVQKQLLLVGPGNRQRIIDWLRRLAGALDLKIG